MKRDAGRIYAGCDLIASVGTPILAVANGVIKIYQNFYWQTYELVIDHGDFTVRYGEVQPPKNKYGKASPPDKVCNGLPEGLDTGSTVSKGQTIAYVGQLRKQVGNSYVNHYETMLHFELYRGTIKDAYGLLTDTKNETNYLFIEPRKSLRRSDLDDPTDFLEKCFTEL